MSAFQHFRRLFLLALVLTAAYACVRPFSSEYYRGQEEGQLYAMICHEGKRTISVPSDQWAEHRAHGDTRGPCRAQGAAARKAPPPRNTSTTFDGYRDREDARRKQLERDAAEARRRSVADSLATPQ